MNKARRKKFSTYSFSIVMSSCNYFSDLHHGLINHAIRVKVISKWKNNPKRTSKKTEMLFGDEKVRFVPSQILISFISKYLVN